MYHAGWRLSSFKVDRGYVLRVRVRLISSKADRGYVVTLTLTLTRSWLRLGGGRHGVESAHMPPSTRQRQLPETPSMWN